MPPATSRTSPTWAPTGTGHELALIDGTLVCRDDQGDPVDPIPADALGTRVYPAWALVHHPADADVALGTLGFLARAAYEKPYDAAGTYEMVARGLPALHRPVFLEHAAHALVAAGDPKRAATLFARAREAETEHDLPVDDAVWLGSHLEFAALGALSAKSVTAFVKRARERFPADQAVDAVADIAVLRARGDLTPWPQFAKEFSALVAKAGRDEISEHRRVLEAIVPTAAARQAPFALWKAWRPMVVRVARDSPRLRGLLLDLFPYPEGIDGWWIDLLDDCGALEALTGDGEPESEPRDGRAGWLSRAVLHPMLKETARHRRRRYVEQPRQLIELIARMSARLAVDGVPVHLDGPGCWSREVDMRVLEACLAHGVPVAPPGAGAGLGMLRWMRHRTGDEDIAATVTDPVYGPLVRRWVDEQRDPDEVWAIPALRSFVRPPAGAGAPPPHPLDDSKVMGSLYGFAVQAATDKGGALRGIQLASAALRGQITLEHDAKLPELTQTVRFTGRVGAVALRAVATSTTDERRERLLALLEVWADSVFADPTVRLRRGTVVTGRRSVSDANGAALLVGRPGDTARLFLDLRAGEADPPALGTVQEVTELPRGWGDSGQLQKLLAMVRERGPLRPDPEAVAVLVGLTGMSRVAATVVLAGITGWGNPYRTPLLEPSEREVLQLTAAEAEVARKELFKLDGDQRLDLLADALPTDPAELWEAGGLVAVAERIARAWGVMFGIAAPVDEATAASVTELDLGMPAVELCSALAQPRATSLLTENVDSWLRPHPAVGTGIGSHEDRAYKLDKLARCLTTLIPWAYTELPAGDPVRSGIPEAVELLRERLAHPGLVLSAGSASGGRRPFEDLEAAFGNSPYQGPEPLGKATFDDGLTIAVQGDRYGHRLFFRPAHYREDERSQTLRDALGHSITLPVIDWIRGEDCTRIAERIRSGAIPEGAYETDPRASVPDLVAQVRERHSLEEDPATLYLQLLALQNPTDRNIRTWNVWKPARHKKAVAALLERGLVVEERRMRAGRSVFLPGGWVTAKKPVPPMERWKAELLGLQLIGDAIRSSPWPHGPLPEIFTAAWQQTLNGGGPR
ncbi:hypothetical protein [Actinomadura rugatobispora]|uniref:DNA-binding protein n=1 Tax=Actinomadura rugatobispora TaxID=1994 RepID=A0ABW0ZXK7_9ACTN|nr:hypothetical protein GCM10010200_100140 [Actinomadura rugatobispora]